MPRPFRDLNQRCWDAWAAEDIAAMRATCNEHVSQGADEEEALANIREAIREYLGAVDDLLEEADVREIEVVV